MPICGLSILKIEWLRGSLLGSTALEKSDYENLLNLKWRFRGPAELENGLAAIGNRSIACATDDGINSQRGYRDGILNDDTGNCLRYDICQYQSKSRHCLSYKGIS